ncbi:hypothetical protein F170042I7_07490 [Blautia caecimuris]
MWNKEPFGERSKTLRFLHKMQLLRGLAVAENLFLRRNRHENKKNDGNGSDDSNGSFYGSQHKRDSSGE